MTRVMKLIGGLLVGIGLIWVLQGMNILPGSFMTGDRQWAINGAIAAVVGAGLLIFAGRKPKA
jgi:hypothetical protein